MTTAQLVIRRKKPLLRSACFHAQQCAEKYLKAILVAHGQKFPKTHDLIDLSDLCQRAGILIPIDKDQLDGLTPHAIRIRYPGMPLDLADAQAALATAKFVRAFARKILGLK
ncbi:MAG: HEPN domain-containing protein [Chloroflexi bacterium]|nr:HEPN domain-containing protein [Chloroflexota bacterium]